MCERRLSHPFGTSFCSSFTKLETKHPLFACLTLVKTANEKSLKLCHTQALLSRVARNVHHHYIRDPIYMKEVRYITSSIYITTHTHSYTIKRLLIFLSTCSPFFFSTFHIKKKFHTYHIVTNNKFSNKWRKIQFESSKFANKF